MKTAILVDGGFYRKRASYLWGKKDADKRASELIAYCQAHLKYEQQRELARREGIDFILDPMWATIKDNLFEHIDGLRSNWGKKDSKSHIDKTTSEKSSKDSSKLCTENKLTPGAKEF